MNRKEESAYLKGERAVWNRLLKQALQGLGYPEKYSHTPEREEALAILRAACADHGDNDWPDDLHLADIIEKHLVRHLEDK